MPSTSLGSAENSKELHVSLSEMSMCISTAVDLVSPDIVDHHKRTAYIAFSIAVELGLAAEEQQNLILAGLLHDIGALSLRDRIDTFAFELDQSHIHAGLGYRLLNTFDAFAAIAPIVRYHHLSWKDGRGESHKGKPVPKASHILHLADRIAVLIDRKREVLGQTDAIRDTLRRHQGDKFAPEVLQAALSLSEKEYFWFDVVSPDIGGVLADKIKGFSTELDLAGLVRLSRFFSRIIDFRSRFTAAHSSGVAATAEALAGLAGLSKRDCTLMNVAGHLHDLGKLAVPNELLEKPQGLTQPEKNIVKSHVYHTHRIIGTVKALETINTWSAYHHERIDGKGYPFRLTGEKIPFESKIMAVADVFSAITEDRPYRSGMSKHSALRTLQGLAGETALEPGLVSLLTENYDVLNAIRVEAQRAATGEYSEFTQAWGAGLPGNNLSE
jgi:HD-GYP domain-containing protein (c-di-GMP phosphodiesterase class II)